MSTFILRRATLDDLDELVALRLKLFRESGYLLSEEPPPEQTEYIIQQEELEEDRCHVHLDRGRFHIGKAATLLNLRRFTSALDELDVADRLTKKDQIRRHAYIDILRAKIYFAHGELEYAAELALSTLNICLAIHSQSNIADIARLYHVLKQSSFGNSPLVTRLGVVLRGSK